MKILFVIDDLGPGGAQRQIVELATSVVGNYKKIVFLIYHENLFYENILAENDIEIIKVFDKNIYVRFYKMCRVIRKSGFNVVVSFLETPNLICELATFPFRNWYLVVSERSSNPSINSKISSRFKRIFHVFADMILTNSQTNLNLVRKANPFLSQSKFKLLYNSLDLELWRPQKDFQYKKNGKLRILVASNHLYNKNLLGLVKAIEMLPLDMRVNIHVKWFGEIRDGSFSEAEQLIKDLSLSKNFSFYGPHLGIINEIYEADCVGLFSYYEGLPNIICEAMACGKPILCSNVSDVHLFFDEETSFLFNPNKTKDIAIQLKRLYRSTPAELIKVGNKNSMVARVFFDRNKNGLEFKKLLKVSEF